MKENNAKVTSSITGTGGISGSYSPMWPTQQHGVCPSCGRCRCCGKQEYPVWTNWPYTSGEGWLGPNTENANVWYENMKDKIEEFYNNALKRDVTPSEKKDGEGTNAGTKV